MASWMVHFRIADGLLDYLDACPEPFIVGNIGPDCGEPNEDWSAFKPPAEVSHWTENGLKRDINSKGFYKEYIENTIVKNHYDKDRLSFYLGYYVHLVTDILWAKKVHIPTMEKFQKEFYENQRFIWEVKKDWYDLDHMFLKSNPEFRAFRIFDKIRSFPNIYLDYFSKWAIEKQIRNISDFYNNHNGNTDREYPYLSKEEADRFVDEVIISLYKELKEKNLVVK
jgi:hypothetical protein